MKTVAIIVAGGKGRRMGRPKQFIKIAGKPMLEWTLSAFQRSKIIDGIILVLAKNNIKRAEKLRHSKIINVVEGGSERQRSVSNGLKQLPQSAEIVLIHDGARPAVTGELIARSVEAAKKHGAAVVGVPVKDTIKKIKDQRSKIKNVEKTLDRRALWQAQTPQVFRKAILLKAYAIKKGNFTDDAGLVEKMRAPVKMVLGDDYNFKVTTPEDIKMMDAILKDRRKRLALFK